MRWGCNGVRKVDDPSVVFFLSLSPPLPPPPPQTFNSPDLYRVSGKFEVLDRMLPKFKASGHRWVGLTDRGGGVSLIFLPVC